MTHPSGPRFALTTAPQQVSYADIQRVWLEADQVPQIEGAWLFDHLLPIGGSKRGPILEGWTALSALAAQTTRLRVGLLVTSNRFRPPAHLAKIAATVDVVSNGRLEFGIGAGSRTDVPTAREEYDAYGLPYVSAGAAVGGLAEACTLIKRLWTSDEPFDFDGRYYQLKGAYGSPKPVQRPWPPFTIGGRADRVLKVIAEHADLWNYPGDDLADAVERSKVLDANCAAIGRDPAAITRSLVQRIDYDHPERTRSAVAQAVEAGFTYFTLSLPAPYPAGVAQWVASEIIGH